MPLAGTERTEKGAQHGKHRPGNPTGLVRVGKPSNLRSRFGRREKEKVLPIGSGGLVTTNQTIAYLSLRFSLTRQDKLVCPPIAYS